MFDFEKDLAEIDGWLTKKEGLFLYEIAKRVRPPSVIVEIGSWKGKSTICLAKGSEAGYKAAVCAIDPHTGSPEHHQKFGKVNTFHEFSLNLKKAKVDRRVHPIRSASRDAVKGFNNPIGLLFIDGNHSIEAVKADFHLWFPKIEEGGIIAFHDSWHSDGPIVVSARALLTSPKIKSPGVVDSITHFEKVAKNNRGDRLKNILFLTYRSPLGAMSFVDSHLKESNILS